MPARPLITVAVAMYQSEATIASCLHSVLSQHRPDVEILVVDDGSNDSSAHIVQSIASADHPIRLISHETNHGLGPARNTGIQNAQGQFIVFLDSDDELLPGSLDAIASVASHTPADLLLIGCLERKRGTDRPMHSDALLKRLATSGETWTASSHPELFFWPPSTWAKVYRRDFLRENDIVFPQGYHQDIPSTIDALLAAESIGAVDHPCYLYIRRGEGSSATQSKGSKTLVRVEQVQRIRERRDISSLKEPLLSHLVTLVTIHLIWGNRAAYRTMPEHLHEQFFADSARELQWWHQHVSPGDEVNSDALMPTSERVFFQKALLSGDFRVWKRALATHQARLRWQRRLDLSRYRLFRSR